MYERKLKKKYEVHIK